MHIHLEKNARHAVQSYGEQSVVIHQVTYQHSLIVNADTVISPWLDDFTAASLEPLLALNPEVIIIGHTQVNFQLPIAVRTHLLQHKIGIECMQLGAACRTFNILLSENRAVVLGLILHSGTHP